MLPAVSLGPYEVSRLIVGGNPFSGFSHQSREMDEAFMDYYTVANIKAALFECERQGINTVLLRADRHIQRVLREYRAEGGTLQWIAQTASELKDQVSHIRQVAPLAIAMYHHGSLTDTCWHEGRMSEVRELLAVMRDCGVVVGLGTHLPEVIEYAEEQGWDVDFYMASFYALTRQHPQQLVVAGGSVPDEIYDDADRERMVAVIRATPKPCLAFKILAAGRKATSVGNLQATFEYAFANIKPTDAVVVGVYQKHMNQVAIDAGIVRDILNGWARGGK
ncbi:MAG: hypothetical protein N2512_07035 [Armatimonadetes bacterium]|nr:hypothetical protein [Armatimonadota bacterium]